MAEMAKKAAEAKKTNQSNLKLFKSQPFPHASGIPQGTTLGDAPLYLWTNTKYLSYHTWPAIYQIFERIICQLLLLLLLLLRCVRRPWVSWKAHFPKKNETEKQTNSKLWNL